MVDNLSFNNLNSTEFEEFCFDLLKELSFVNINWRKGTGFDASPSDEGRDIECELIKKEIDDKIYNERWFVQCKHFKSGIPPEKIQGILTWANAERPDKVLIICSNFLSNSCKNYLEKYVLKNKPTFKILIWELKDLESLVFGKIKLLKKYNLSEGLDFLEIMHPLHINYISKPQYNTLDYLFSILDNLDITKRDKILQETYYYFINPRHREPITGGETLGELEIDKVDYWEFKRKCYAFSLPEPILVQSILTIMFSWAFHFGNKTNIEKIKQANKFLFEEFNKELKTAKEEERGNIKKMMRFHKELYDTLPKRTEEAYKDYIYLCESVLPKLLEEQIIFED